MIDHISVPVSDYARAKALYAAAVAPLGWTLVLELTRAMVPSLPCEATCGFGPGRPVLWLRPTDGGVTPFHLALRAPDRAAVDAFHRAALEAGATDHGAPGPRPHYHASYYGGFVLDHDGHNLEAVCHEPE